MNLPDENAIFKITEFNIKLYLFNIKLNIKDKTVRLPMSVLVKWSWKFYMSGQVGWAVPKLLSKFLYRTGSPVQLVDEDDNADITE